MIGKVDKLKILEYRDTYVVVNENGEYKHHTHIKRYKTCEMFVKLVERKIVPKSSYLRSSAKRVTLDQKYIDKIDIKIKKDRNKPKYYRP